MVQTSASRLIALALSLLFIVQGCAVTSPSWVGLYAGAPVLARLAYPWFHGGVLHALCNAWCLLSIVFYYGCSLRRLSVAFFIAVSMPSVCLSATPAIGFSGVLYAVLGLMSFSVKRRLYWQGYLWLGILLGLLIPHLAVAVHAYCFAVGTLFAFFSAPIIPIHSHHSHNRST